MKQGGNPVKRLLASIVAVLAVMSLLIWWTVAQPVPNYHGQYSAAAGEFPWMVATLTDDAQDFNCGGVLISHQWVLSAKHCYQGLQPGDVQVRVGSIDWYDGGQLVDVSEIELQPDPNQDLAMLRLAQPLDRGYVLIGAPPSAYQIGTDAETLGWGTRNQRSQDYRTYLRWTHQVIAKESTCGGGSHGVFCAGRPHGEGSGTCDGDSGGPLLWSESGFDTKGSVIGTPYVLGTLRGLNNSSCYLPGHNDDWQSVDYGLPWITSVLTTQPDDPLPASEGDAPAAPRASSNSAVPSDSAVPRLSPSPDEHSAKPIHPTPTHLHPKPSMPTPTRSAHS